jgi:hypothetical protein
VVDLTWDRIEVKASNSGEASKRLGIHTAAVEEASHRRFPKCWLTWSIL